MKTFERESFLKSFSIFFLSIGILIGVIYFINYTKDVQKLDEKLFSEMRICSFDLECSDYEIDFVLTGDKEFYKLYKTDSIFAGYFPIPNSYENSMKIYYVKEKYTKDIEHILQSALKSFSLTMIVVVFLALLFSWYTLYPLRNALYLMQEFIKDILHDFNTPLSTLRLNSSMLAKELGENKKVERIQTGIQTILNLQNNLRAYLNNTPLLKEVFDLKVLLSERIELLKMSYKRISFELNMQKVILETNKDALTRIIDNLLSNAAKYNKDGGSVRIYMDKTTTLVIEDTGKGIQNPKKIFERFYKEQDRGIGIGLHIVEKLSSELGIKISLISKRGDGTTIMLDLKMLTSS